MLALFAIIRTELQLLLRDVPGLIILFVMPMLLVLTLTVLHSGESKHPTQLPVLLLDYDNNKVGKQIVDKLKKSDYFEITNITGDKDYDKPKAKEDVITGKYQVLIIIPAGLTQSVEDYTRWLTTPKTNQPKEVTLKVLLDPTLPPALKDSISSNIESIDRTLQMKAMQSVLQQLTHSDKLNEERPVLKIKTGYAHDKGVTKKPTAVQQYVPAWTLFGMFLIMIPIAGIFVKERDQGILQRFYVAPTSRFTFLLGRILTFIFVNMIQLVLLLSLGVFILPLLDLPALDVSHHIPYLLIAGLVVSCAATGFGVLLGTWTKSFEQAMALGPTLIIIAAAIGGIMLPIYLMPEKLRFFSEFSPLYWGQNAFLNILVRDADFNQLIPDVTKLFIFFLVTVTLALFKYMQKR